MKNFTKANLMTGDMIETRSGKRATVMLNTPIGNILRFHTEKDSFSYLDTRYSDTLTHNNHENLDIVKVYRVDPTKLPSNKIGDLVANPEKMLEYGQVVYDRWSSDEADSDDNESPVTASFEATACEAETNDEVGESQKPTKAVLQTGDMLVHRNGKVSTVYKDTPVGDITRYHTESNSFSYLSNFDEELIHNDKTNFDVVAVFRTAETDMTKAGDLIGNPEKMITKNNLLWSESYRFNVSFVYNEEQTSFVFPNAVVDIDDFDDEEDCDD